MQFYNLIRAKNLLMLLVKIKFFAQKDNVLMLTITCRLEAYNFCLSYYLFGNFRSGQTFYIQK